MIAGAALLILGIAVYGVADMKLNEYQDLSGAFDRAFDDSDQKAYQNWQIARTAGMVAGGIGAVLLTVSLITALKESG